MTLAQTLELTWAEYDQAEAWKPLFWAACGALPGQEAAFQIPTGTVFHELLCFHTSLLARCQLPLVLDCLF